jgi:hypothetical protein
LLGGKNASQCEPTSNYGGRLPYIAVRHCGPAILPQEDIIALKCGLADADMHYCQEERIDASQHDPISYHHPESCLALQNAP